MSPLNRIIWMRASKARKTEVTIRDGRRFLINYDVRPIHFPASNVVRKLVHIKPADGKFAPSGYFNLDHVQTVDWVKEAKGEMTQDTVADVKS